LEPSSLVNAYYGNIKSISGSSTIPTWNLHFTRNKIEVIDTGAADNESDIVNLFTKTVIEDIESVSRVNNPTVARFFKTMVVTTQVMDLICRIYFTDLVINESWQFTIVEYENPTQISCRGRRNDSPSKKRSREIITSYEIDEELKLMDSFKSKLSSRRLYPQNSDLLPGLKNVFCWATSMLFRVTGCKKDTYYPASSINK